MAKASKAAAPKKERAAPPKKKSGKPVKKELKIKYEDKSPGQPALAELFQELSRLLEPYAKGSLEKHGGSGGKLALISNKEVEIGGRKRENLWFVSLLVQKGYVGFYFMPVYMNPAVRIKIKPELLKCLKGKACFHIKKRDPLIFEQIREALEIGHKAYKDLGWI
jgi:hypothetical protein